LDAIVAKPAPILCNLLTAVEICQRALQPVCDDDRSRVSEALRIVAEDEGISKPASALALKSGASEKSVKRRENAQILAFAPKGIKAGGSDKRASAACNARGT
jgi:hypothetical protein